MTDLPADLLRRWPGRFRFGQLLVGLDGNADPDPAALADAILDGIVRGRDHAGALDDLIRAGHFAAARRMLTEDQELTDRQLTRAHEQLDASLARHSQELASRLRKLGDLATGAGLPVPANHKDLEALARRSWPQARTELDRAEADLRRRIDQERIVIEGRLQAARLPDAMTAVLRRLLNSSRLADAVAILDQGRLGCPGPEAVAPLRRWTWPDSPRDVLGWHLGMPRPPEFREWETADDASYRVLANFHVLSEAEATALSFAASLDAFLGPPGAPPPVSRVADGWLTRLGNVFADAETGVFGPDQGVDLFIADPQITAPPPELAAVGRLICVGPSMEPPVGRPRDECAILTLQDLLRLVTAPGRRPVALLRILARQWPLAALGAGSARHVDALLGRDPDRRWLTLRWLVDLAGLGGLEMAGMLASQTGYHGPVLHLLLDYLSGSGTRPADPQWWSDDEQLSAEVEAAALREIRDSPTALLAFWAALRSAPPGQPVTLDAMVISVALDGDGAERDRELRAGLVGLSRLWCAEVSAESSVRLGSHGVVIGLRGRAQHRIRALAQQLAESAGEPEGSQPLKAWDAYRFALGERWLAYQGAGLGADDEESAASSARQGLMIPPEELAAAAAQADPAGQADLARLADDVRLAFTARYPRVTLTVEGPRSAWAAISERAAMVLLYELLSNAAEALDDGGLVAISIEPSTVSSGDLVIDVRDSGPGIAGDIPRDHLVFRRGISTRGPGRGVGLMIARDLARRADGDLELVSRSARHPVLRGAHFRLILPGHPAGPALRPGVVA